MMSPHNISPSPANDQWQETDLRFLMAQYHVAMSYQAIGTGRFIDVIEHCQRALVLTPNYSTPCINMGVMYNKLNKHKMALGWFKKAIELAPTRVSSYVHYGNCLYKSGDIEEAGKQWKRAKELAHNDESKSEEWEKIAENNISVFNREMAFYPLENEIFIASEVKTKRRILDIGQAEREIRESMPYYPFDNYKLAEKIFLWVWENYEFGLHEGSDSILDVLDNRRGNCATLTTFFSLLFKRFGLDTNLMLFGSHVFISFEYQGRRVDIETTSEKGFDTNLHKNRPGVKKLGLESLPSVLYHNQSNKYYVAGNVKKAKMLLNKSIQKCPELALSYSSLSDIYVSQRNLEKAVELKRKAIKIDPYFHATFAELGVLLFWLNKPESGAKCFHRALHYAYSASEAEVKIKEYRDIIDTLLQTYTPEKARTLKELVYFPPGIKDTLLFNKYVIWEPVDKDAGKTLVYKIDFKGDEEAYLSIRLGDMLEVNSVLVYDKHNNEFKEACKAKDDHYYYVKRGNRVYIKTGSLFFVPLENIPFDI